MIPPQQPDLPGIVPGEKPAFVDCNAGQLEAVSARLAREGKDDCPCDVPGTADWGVWVREAPAVRKVGVVLAVLLVFTVLDWRVILPVWERPSPYRLWDNTRICSGSSPGSQQEVM